MSEYKSDIDIARSVTPKAIAEIGKKLNIEWDDLRPFGHEKAKISQDLVKKLSKTPKVFPSPTAPKSYYSLGFLPPQPNLAK